MLPLPRHKTVSLKENIIIFSIKAKRIYDAHISERTVPESFSDTDMCQYTQSRMSCWKRIAQDTFFLEQNFSSFLAKLCSLPVSTYMLNASVYFSGRNVHGAFCFRFCARTIYRHYTFLL